PHVLIAVGRHGREPDVRARARPHLAAARAQEALASHDGRALLRQRLVDRRWEGNARDGVRPRLFAPLVLSEFLARGDRERCASKAENQTHQNFLPTRTLPPPGESDDLADEDIRWNLHEAKKNAARGAL